MNVLNFTFLVYNDNTNSPDGGIARVVILPGDYTYIYLKVVCVSHIITIYPQRPINNDVIYNCSVFYNPIIQLHLSNIGNH